MHNSLSYSSQYFIPSSPSLSLQSPHAWMLHYLLHNRNKMKIKILN